MLPLVLTALTPIAAHAQKIISTGFFTGLTIPFTIDDGISNDPRYQTRYDIKWAPVGLHVGMDIDDFGFFVSPSFLKTSQNFWVINTVGGQIGKRKINTQYINFPLSVKAKIIDLTFFRLSGVASVGAGFLIKGTETISHEPGKMNFPLSALPHLPPDYTPDYDGVTVPQVDDLEIVGSSDFTSMQLFGSLGLRSDWDVADHLRVSFDLRGYYGFLETRSTTYLNQLQSDGALYDVYGKRREIFVYLTVGVSRTMEIDKKESKFQKQKYKMKRRRLRG
ncbi:MAG: PorT family protein [Bacteroidia bacterium]|nr:PorT family protein [Bacteroidia bacterium]